MDAEEEDMVMDKARKVEEIEQELAYHEAQILVLRRELNDLLDELSPIYA